jgi:hypothetical protein
LGFFFILKSVLAERQWLTPIILATQEEEIRKIKEQSQPQQIALRDDILKKPITKMGCI